MARYYNQPPHRLTQHKKLMSLCSIYPSDFVPYGTHPNPALIFDGAKLVEGLNHKED